MTPMDQDKFVRELTAHFRRCGQPLPANEPAYYFQELKKYHVDEVIKALDMVERSDRKASFRATVADVKRMIAHARRESNQSTESNARVQCGNYDSDDRCKFAAVAQVDGQKAYCSLHFMAKRA